VLAGLLSGTSAAADHLVWVGRWELLFSIALFVIVFGLTRALRNASPVLRHALWGLVLLRLVLPVGLTSPFSVGGLVAQGTAATGAESAWVGCRWSRSGWWALSPWGPSWWGGAGATAG
jgi:hypothetical protein